MPEQPVKALTADDIIAQVRSLRAGNVDRDSVEGFRQAAAVLAAISQPRQLRPVKGPFEPGLALRVLRDDLVKAPALRLRGELMLSHNVRRATLKAMGSRERMIAALDANPDERSGPVQQQLENYLTGQAKRLEDQTREELESTLQVLLWLTDIVPDLPDINDARSLLAWRDFMAPFEALAGDDVFRGRDEELDDLRTFVGVLAPRTLRGQVIRAVDFFRPSPLRSLSVFGPGGVGKSALIARFILEHSRLPGELRIPIAYLDFDRSTLSVTDPRGLAEEILRQLILQFPRAADFQNLRDSLPPAASDDAANAPVRTFNFETVLRDLMATVDRVLPGRPYLFVLDTFEQVQYLGETHALSLWQIFGKVQERFPFLRIVVSGRAPVSTLRLGGDLPTPLQVGNLGREAAVSFARAASKFKLSEETASAIVSSVGGVPLSIKLAVRLLSDDPNASVSVGSRYWIRVSDEVVQGQLFDRILEQIRDPEVQRVAHPGLVLRRLTPEVLLEVLREPCELAITNLVEAQALFERLQNEVSLVASSDEGDGALVHRREVREVMLRLLKRKLPALVDQISERAVRYYAELPGTRARMEQTYHQLLLKRPVPRAAFDDREVRASIQASVTELPIESQQLLATYGFQVDAAVVAKATAEQREAAVAEFVEQMLPHGAEGFAQARARLDQMAAVDHDSPLWRARARLSFEAGDPDGAAAALLRGLDLASPTDNSFRVLELLSDQAWQQESRSQFAALEDTLDQLDRYAQRHNDAAALLQHFLQIGRLRGSWFTAAIDPPTARRLFKALRPRDFFGLLPATRGLWRAAIAAGLNGELLAQLITNPESNFDSVTFPNHPETQRAVQVLLNAAYSRLSREGNDWEDLASAIDTVIAVWPYRNLHVHPPQADTRRFAR